VAVLPEPRAQPVAVPAVDFTPPMPWRRNRGGSDWVAIDLETTGFYWRTDRVVEIGIVRHDERGRELDAWTSLLDPQRDIGATFIHGITSRDVLGAPTFRVAAPEILARIGNARLVAHNARFDLGFLGAELTRAGVDWGKPEAFCTMSVPYEYGIVENRRLVGCCEELGIPMESHHCALNDARAAGAILFIVLGRMGRLPDLPAITPAWPTPSPLIAPCLRGQPFPLAEGNLGALADRVGVPEGLPVSSAVALAYLNLLDRALEDRRLTPDEVVALGAAARDWGISTATAGELHRAYLARVAELALADGVITAAERADLARLTELLGVSPGSAGTLLPVQAPTRTEPFAGRTVCFTGESVCTIGGAPISRADQEDLARKAGLIVKENLSAKLDVLVLADPDSRSGKARRADELGVRKIVEPSFWRAIGVRID
jgi:DNA polymerase-3 subunit epsilon